MKIAVLLLILYGSQASEVRVEDGVSATGAATESWRSMIRNLGPERTAGDARPMTASERAWRDLIRSRARQWESETALLTTNFSPVKVPDVVRVVIGNQGGEDAFTSDERTIGFDVSRLSAEYGEADRDRIDRFFRHEYVHLLQKAWLREFPYAADTPLRSALLGMWQEGLGHYYSLSPRWRGEESEAAKRALGGLQPRLVARLSALACASDEEGRKLIADLSFGWFDQKWGALPVALWLEAEARRSPEALREFVSAGPDGIWQHAERHLAAGDAVRLRGIRASAARCRTRRVSERPGGEASEGCLAETR